MSPATSNILGWDELRALELSFRANCELTMYSLHIYPAFLQRVSPLCTLVTICELHCSSQKDDNDDAVRGLSPAPCPALQLLSHRLFFLDIFISDPCFAPSNPCPYHHLQPLSTWILEAFAMLLAAERTRESSLHSSVTADDGLESRSTSHSGRSGEYRMIDPLCSSTAPSGRRRQFSATWQAFRSRRQVASTHDRCLFNVTSVATWSIGTGFASTHLKRSLRSCEDARNHLPAVEDPWGSEVRKSTPDDTVVTEDGMHPEFSSLVHLVIIVRLGLRQEGNDFNKLPYSCCN